MRHLVLDISGHGYGHLAQIVPVVAALRDRDSTVRLTVRTQIPPSVWRERLGPTDAAPPPPEPILAMDSAIDVRIDDTLRDYLRLLKDYPALIAAQSQRLARLRPDLLLANVPFLSLAAARAAGVPAIALSSLNWADVLEELSPAGRCTELVACMREAYAAADRFIRVTPAMPMAWLANQTLVGPVGLVATNRREALEEMLRLAPETRLGIVGIGGIPTALPLAGWPVRARWHWLAPAALAADRPDMTAIEATGLTFSEALASADLVVTKPGYGTFVEAALLGLPVIYVERPTWPEEPGLSEWLHQHTRAMAISPSQFFAGDFTDQADALVAAEAPPRARPTGNEEAALLIEAALR